MPDSLGDAAQTRLIVEQVAEAVIVKYDAEHPRRKEVEIPAPLKWLGGLAVLVLGALVVGYFNWLTTTVGEMQVTLARMDERMASGSVKDARVDELDRRVTSLERFHQGGGK